jgi:signal transduction histidine kinase
VEFDIDNIDNLLRKEDEINFYRIIQECMSNIIKHSKAESAEIKIRKLAESIEISITDDGIGFDMNELKNRKSGIGLIGMQERVNILNGEYIMNSSPGNGTIIKISIRIK